MMPHYAYSTLPQCNLMFSNFPFVYPLTSALEHDIPGEQSLTKREVFYQVDTDEAKKKFTSLKLIRKFVHGLFVLKLVESVGKRKKRRRKIAKSVALKQTAKD